MYEVLEAVEDFLKEEFGDYQFMEAGCQQKPTPGYRYHFRDENGWGHNIHFSNPFLQDNTPEEVVPRLECLGVELSAREFAEENVVVLISNGGINIQNL